MEINDKPLDTQRLLDMTAEIKELKARIASQRQQCMYWLNWCEELSEINLRLTEKMDAIKSGGTP